MKEKGMTVGLRGSFYSQKEGLVTERGGVGFEVVEELSDFCPVSDGK